MNDAAQVTREQAVAALWAQGVLTWKVRAHQLPVYGLLAGADGDFQTVLAYVHRQFGKSFLALLVAVEVALRVAMSRISVVAPTAKMLRGILLPNMSALLADCPEPLKPSYQALDNVYTFSNGSTIRLDGADAGNADALRGRANHLVVVDEAGFVKDLRSLIHDIIQPSFLTTNGRLLLITTPPKTAGHYVTALRHELARKGAFIKVKLSDNPSITPEKRKRMADEAGGDTAPAFLREYECEEITDGDLAVCPEFNAAAQAKLVRPVPPPDPYVARVVGMDLGWSDPTAVLYGYYDFKTARLVLQEESLLKKARISEIADEIKAKEAALWPGTLPYSRISDVDPMVLAELSAEHGLHFRPVTKALKEQMVNEVRQWIRDERILIDPACAGLVAQLEAAIWTGTRRAFEHTEAFGHFDLVDALVYLLQALPREHNPYPVRPAGISEQTHVILPGAFPDPNEAPLRKLFQPVQPPLRRGTWGF